MGRLRPGRQRKNRQLQHSIDLWVEGKTEVQYFQAWRQNLGYSALNVKCYSGARADVVEQIAKERSKWPKWKKSDVVIILLDLDAYKKDEYDHIHVAAKKYGFEIYESNPNFELWLSAHYGSVKPSPMTNAKMKRIVEKNWGFEYRKTHSKIGEMAQNYKTAFENVTGIKVLELERNLNYTNIDEMMRRIISSREIK